MDILPSTKPSKYKAKFVAKGFMQRLELDYDEDFTLVARNETMRLVVPTVIYKDGSCISWM